MDADNDTIGIPRDKRGPGGTMKQQPLAVAVMALVATLAAAEMVAPSMAYASLPTKAPKPCVEMTKLVPKLKHLEEQEVHAIDALDFGTLANLKEVGAAQLAAFNSELFQCAFHKHLSKQCRKAANSAGTFRDAEAARVDYEDRIQTVDRSNAVAMANDVSARDALDVGLSLAVDEYNDPAFTGGGQDCRNS